MSPTVVSFLSPEPVGSLPCMSIDFILTERVRMGWFPRLHSLDVVEMETFQLRQKSGLSRFVAFADPREVQHCRNYMSTSHCSHPDSTSPKTGYRRRATLTVFVIRHGIIKLQSTNNQTLHEEKTEQDKMSHKWQC